MEAIPFQTMDAYAGFAEANGLLRLEKDGIVIQFQIKDGFFGALKGEVKEISIPINQIQSITYKKGFFSPSLSFVVNDLNLMHELPGYEQGEVTFHFKRKFRNSLMNFKSRIEMKITDYQLKHLNEDL